MTLSVSLRVGRSAILLASMFLLAGAPQLEAQNNVRASFTDAGGSREFVLYRPASITAASRALVVMLHGCTQTADDFARGTRMNEAADRGGFLVLYPEQTAGAHPQKCWNWYSPDQTSRDRGEAGLLAALIDSIARKEGVTANRIAVVGMSAGAAMAANLVADYPERYGALAMHSGLPAFAANDVMTALAVMKGMAPVSDSLAGPVLNAMGSHKRRVNVLALQGGADKVVSPTNLERIKEQWTAVNARTGPNGGSVETQLFALLGHAWSGGSATGSYTAPEGADATGLIVEFLKRVGVLRA